MELTLALVNAFVVLAVGLGLTYLVNDRSKSLATAVQAETEALRADLERLRAGTKEDIARLEARMDSGFNAVRSDLTRVALAVGAGGAAAEG